MTIEFASLSPFESKIDGGVYIKEGTVFPDENARRVSFLIEKKFIFLAIDSTGWFKLYRDPQDNRLWELWYADSDYQGGGVPSLRCISDEQARLKYVFS